jgi:hypothetical protein
MILKILTHTPISIWILAAVLVRMGYRSRFTRVQNVLWLILIPTLFVTSGINSIHSLFGWTQTPLRLVLSAIAIGSTLGALLTYQKSVAADRSRLLIQLPGDWITFLVIMMNFVFQYLMNVTSHINRPYFDEHQVFFLMTMVILTGVTVGRNATYLYKWVKTPNSI